LRGDLPTHIDATWHYESGLRVHLHGAWDDNPIRFRMAFRVQLERATLDYDSLRGDDVWLHSQDGSRLLPLSSVDAYQAQLDEFVACALENRPAARVTIESSRLSLHYALKEWEQLRL
jgi:hypothetical protein